MARAARPGGSGGDAAQSSSRCLQPREPAAGAGLEAEPDGPWITSVRSVTTDGEDAVEDEAARRGHACMLTRGEKNRPRTRQEPPESFAAEPPYARRASHGGDRTSAASHWRATKRPVGSIWAWIVAGASRSCTGQRRRAAASRTERERESPPPGRRSRPGRAGTERARTSGSPTSGAVRSR